MGIRKDNFGALALVGAAALLAGCAGGDAKTARASAEPDQVNICEVRGWQHDVVAKACKPGQKVAYLPSSWGNEQLPILFAAVNCDLRYQVVSTHGGVSCIYQPITPREEAKGG